MNNIYDFNDCFQTRSDNCIDKAKRREKVTIPREKRKIFEQGGNGIVAHAHQDTLPIFLLE